MSARREIPDKTTQFKIHGLDCVDEIAALRRVVGPVVGGPDRLSFDLLNATMTAPVEVATADVLTAVARSGLRAEVLGAAAPLLDPGARRERQLRALLTAFAGILTVAGFLVHAVEAGGALQAVGREGLGHTHAVPFPSTILYTAAILCGVWFVLPRAWTAARRLRPDMNLLMTIAVIGAVVLGEWLEASTVAFLFAVSLALETWSISRARRAIAALLDLSPPMARLRAADGHEQSVPLSEVAIGASFVVFPGERFPLDGVVESGFSAVNQSPITGESVPVEKGSGDDVSAGTINGDGVVVARATHLSGDTTLAHIIRLVRDAQGKRAAAEQWVERFARYYTPLVMALAVIVSVLPPLLAGGGWSDWFYRALVLLVIACPCALVISTPVSVVAALAAAARMGILIKGGMFLELPARLRAMAFDKTGTVTLGRPAVSSILPLNGHTERELLERIGALEMRSEHPLARAIVEYANQRAIDLQPAEDVTILQGKGAIGNVRGKTYWVGSHRYLEERGLEDAAIHARLDELLAEGGTVVVAGTDEHVCGLIALADSPRPGVGRVLQELHVLGIRRLVMLTGDNRPTAESIAKSVGMDDVRAELLPNDKVAIIEDLVREHGNVAMIGDGVNDAPAMARATLGIAMGAAGTDAAIETADVALMSDDLAKLPWLIRHSRRTVGIIQQNIAFALTVKALFVVLTFTGTATLWSAIAADMGASLLVILNGLRLLRLGER